MPKNKPPRKPRTPAHRKTSTVGAWDQLHSMIASSDQLLALGAASVRLLAERERIESDKPFDKDRALQLANLLVKDTKTFKDQLDAIRATVGTNRGDIKENDMDALMVTLQAGQQLSDWTERWTAIVAPTIGEIETILNEV